jgi:hypothetical protein
MELISASLRVLRQNSRQAALRRLSGMVEYTLSMARLIALNPGESFLRVRLLPIRGHLSMSPLPLRMHVVIGNPIRTEARLAPRCEAIRNLRARVEPVGHRPTPRASADWLELTRQKTTPRKVGKTASRGRASVRSAGCDARVREGAAGPATTPAASPATPVRGARPITLPGRSRGPDRAPRPSTSAPVARRRQSSGEAAGCRILRLHHCQRPRPR